MSDPKYVKRADSQSVVYDAATGWVLSGGVEPFPSTRREQSFVRRALHFGRLVPATEEEYQAALPPPPPVDPAKVGVVNTDGFEDARTFYGSVDPDVFMGESVPDGSYWTDDDGNLWKKVNGSWENANPTVEALSNVDPSDGAEVNDALVKAEVAWIPKAIEVSGGGSSGIEVIGYDGAAGAGAFALDIPAAEAGDVAIICFCNMTSITETFTPLGNSTFGFAFHTRIRSMQAGEVLEGVGGDNFSIFGILIRNAEYIGSSVGSERWGFSCAAPVATAPAGSLDILMSARQMSSLTTGWPPLPSYLNQTGGSGLWRFYDEETALSAEVFNGGTSEWNGGGRVLLGAVD